MWCLIAMGHSFSVVVGRASPGSSAVVFFRRRAWLPLISNRLRSRSAHRRNTTLGGSSYTTSNLPVGRPRRQPKRAAAILCVQSVRRSNWKESSPPRRGSERSRAPRPFKILVGAERAGDRAGWRRCNASSLVGVDLIGVPAEQRPQLIRSSPQFDDGGSSFRSALRGVSGAKSKSRGRRHRCGGRDPAPLLSVGRPRHPHAIREHISLVHFEHSRKNCGGLIFPQVNSVPYGAD